MQNKIEQRMLTGINKLKYNNKKMQENLNAKKGNAKKINQNK
jgi:adenylosuccinate lyase